MDMLARREHSRLELEQKLRGRADNNETLTAALDQLTTEKLLCDERFCEAFVRSRMNGGYGPVRIRAELKERGISETLITCYLDEKDDGWLERLSDLVDRKFGPQPDQELKSLAKRQRFLLQRGYTFDQIRAVLRNTGPGSH